MGTLPIRVLIIEGDVTRSVSAMLASAGSAHIVVTQCDRLEEALEIVRRGVIDIVLLSSDIGATHGYESAASFHEALPTIPFIVLAASDDDTLAMQVLQSGAQDVLVRDQFGSTLLLRTIHHAIERHELVAQLNQALAQARSDEANLRNVIVRSADGMIVLDEGAKVVFVNPAAERVLGRSAESLRGKRLPHEIRAGETKEVEVHQPGKDSIFLEMRAVALEWERRHALLVVARDLTDRKRAEELRTRLIHADRLAAVGQLAAGVAHEINNPATYILANQAMIRESLSTLSSIHSSLDGFVEKQAGPEQQEELRAIFPKDTVHALMHGAMEMLADNTSGMHRIRTIVKDLRTFARVEQENVEEVQLGEVVEVACNLLFNEVRHRARLVRDTQPVPMIAADRGKLAQVVMNLVLNAVQAIEEGAADRNQIRLTTRQAEDTVVLSVEDTGAGIPEEIRSRIFEPFFTTKPRDVGTGLGLSLCADIVRKHGGEIHVKSELGKGTRVDVVLPLRTGLEVPHRQVPQPAARSRHRPRILIIDDEPTLLKAFRRMLESRCEVVVATGGVEGLSTLEKERQFDMVLCDLMMPEIDGPMIYEQLRLKMPALLERIVYCSGGAFTPRAKEFMSQVPNLFLEKPVSREHLLEVIERVTGSRQEAMP